MRMCVCGTKPADRGKVWDKSEAEYGKKSRYIR